MHGEPVPEEDFFHRLAEAAGDAALRYFRTDLGIANKDASGFDPVTAGDRDAEAAMRVMIEAHYPGHGILGEEAVRLRLDAEYVWVLDPIDGTRAYIAGIPLWGTLIGLARHGVPIAGMMSQPFIGERFYGAGSYARYTGPGGERTLVTRPCGALSEALLCTTSPDLFGDADRLLYAAVERDVRLARYGTDCYAYCLLAAGHVDTVIESGLKPYDIVALIPIIEAAGGVVTDWDGGPAASGGRILACGDRRLHDILLRRLAG